MIIIIANQIHGFTLDYGKCILNWFILHFVTWATCQCSALYPWSSKYLWKLLVAFINPFVLTILPMMLDFFWNLRALFGNLGLPWDALEYSEVFSMDDLY